MEESELTRKAKYTTAYGQAEYTPSPQRRAGMKRKLMPVSRHDPPLAVITTHYRDLDTLTKRGVVSEMYNPPWLAAYRRQQAEEAAQRQQQMMMQHRAQPRHGEAIDLDAIGPTGRFASGEVVDLT